MTIETRLTFIRLLLLIGLDTQTEFSTLLLRVVLVLMPNNMTIIIFVYLISTSQIVLYFLPISVVLFFI